MNLLLRLSGLLLLVAINIHAQDNEEQQRPSFSRINSRPVVIRLPARRPRIRPLPTFAPPTEPEESAELPQLQVPDSFSRPRPPPPPQPRLNRPPLVRPPVLPQTPRLPPVVSNIGPPAAPAAPGTNDAPVVTVPPVPTISPNQLNEILGLAGLNGEPRLPNSGIQNLPDLSSFTKALASGRM